MVRISTGAAALAMWSAVSLSWAQQAQPAPAPAPTPSPLVAPAAPAASGAVVDDGSTPPAPATAESNTPPSLEAPADNAPPPIDAGAPAAEVPPAQVAPAPERPFLARFGGLESGLMVGALAAGWLATGLVGGLAVLGAASWASGRVQFDFPLTMWNTVTHANQDTEGSRIFSGQNAGVMMGTLIFVPLAGAVAAAGVATLIGMLSQDWETSMGPIGAAAVLAGALCAGLGGTLFVASLVVPFPPLWLATFCGALFLSVAVPPVAVLVGMLLTKKARAVPGGLLNQLLQALPVNPLTRPAAPAPAR